jgi:hypothetical protein
MVLTISGPEDLVQGGLDSIHLNLVVGLLEERAAVGGADHESVRNEAEVLDLLFRFRSRRVDVLRGHLPGEFLLEPAHGGLQTRADNSAGEVVVGHVHRVGMGERFLAAGRSPAVRAAASRAAPAAHPTNGKSEYRDG